MAPRVKVSLDVKMVPNLKTALVWGTLPGATDETIYVIAHKRRLVRCRGGQR